MNAGRAMTAPWPCATCGAPGIRNLGTHGYCAWHLAEFYRTIPPEAWPGVGVGLLDGAHRPDHAPEMYDLACVLCDATWVGTLLARCSWCADRLEAQRAAQAAILLHPELPDVDDRRYDGALRGWAERLARGVEAELVVEAEAQRALQRIGRRHERSA